MSSYGSWSVKGIDDRARALAKEAAREKGMTLGDYINDLLLDGHSEAGPRDVDDDQFSRPEPSTDSQPLDGLARRIEAVEAKSTLAITGIDQSVLGLLARLDATENNSAAIAADVERVIDELRETHEGLVAKVQNLEEEDTSQQNLQAMKALEQALGKLAAHVHEENGLQQEEAMAIKGRVEAGFMELNDRVEGMEVRVESTLSETAQRVEKAVEQAELRAEGASRHLSERFTAIESSVATKLAKVDEVDGRMHAVESDVTGAIGSMENTLLRIQERLNRAETTTDTALKALEQTFESLDKKIETVAVHANPERAEALRRQFEERFEGMAANLRTMVEQARSQLANEIERAAAGQNPELMGHLQVSVAELKQHIQSSEGRSAKSLEDMTEQVNRISTGLDERIMKLESGSSAAVTDTVLDVVGDVTGDLEARLSQIETRDDNLIDKFSVKMTELADRLEQRVQVTEETSAEAIQQVGEQVAGAVNRLQAKQDSQFDALESRLAASDKRHDARLSKALSNVSERLTEMQHKTASVVSPVQKAIASLAARLEDVESFNAPPGLAAPVEALPDMPAMLPEPTKPIDVPVEPPIETNRRDVLEIKDQEPAEDEDFVAGLTEIAEEAPEAGVESTAAEDDWAADFADAFEPEAAQAEEDFGFSDEDYMITEDGSDIPSDPLADLGNWDDARDEARESDIFSSDEIEADKADNPNIDDAFADTIFVRDEQSEANEPGSGTAELSEEDKDILGEDAPKDEQAADYLSRARRAAIEAAETEEQTKATKRGRSRASKASGAHISAMVETKRKKRSKLPVYAAASVLALTAAGAGAWVSLRGKQPVTADGFVLPQNQAPSEEAQVQSPTLDGVEYADAETTIEEDLFDPEQGSRTPATETDLSLTQQADIVRASLPLIPEPTSMRDAALRGDPVAEYLFGEERLKIQDFAKGAQFIGSAAGQGQPAAQYKFAKLHESGLGVPKDLTSARSWTEKSAKAGNIKAMHDLAVFYADGEGGDQSYAAAAQWFRSAADYGLIDSQYNLAMLYESGLGVSPSQTEALYWLEVAARLGDTAAPEKITELRQKVTLEEAQSAQRRAASWTAVKAVPAANGQFPVQAWQIGNRDQIKAIQTVLAGLGYEPGTPDGIAGAGTRAAITAFQTDHGLSPTGNVDASLIETLNAMTQADA